MTIRHTIAASAGLAIALHLAGCDKRPQTPDPEQRAAVTAAAAPVASAAPAASPAPSAPAPSSPAPSASQERDPAKVLRGWADAVERRDWAAVRALWGNGGADSGVTPAAFAARWDRLERPHVTIGTGTQEGAAGSLYYAAPVRIVAGGRIIGGQVTLRRVNDVDGASAEQLRWHLDRSVQAPWTTAG